MVHCLLIGGIVHCLVVGGGLHCLLIGGMVHRLVRGGMLHCRVPVLTALWLPGCTLTESSARMLGDKTIKAGSKAANSDPNSCDFFILIHRELFVTSLIPACCWRVIYVSYGTVDSEDLILDIGMIRLSRSLPEEPD